MNISSNEKVQQSANSSKLNEETELYHPIENYGIIGDLNTIALVSLEGSIDFLCLPNFDSPSVFAAILDKKKGGHFKIFPTKDHVKHKQLYLPDTNVLLTRFLAKDGVGEITDFMPVEEMYVGKEIVRTVSCVRGKINFILDCKPRFNYGLSTHSTEVVGKKEIIFRSNGEDKSILRLRSTLNLSLIGDDVYADFALGTGEKETFILEYLTEHPPNDISPDDFATKTMFATINYWKDWVSRSQYRGRWMEIVNRSALVLKLMTSKKYGSIVASPTFGLPEEIGGVRNWDYRYTWIRDASFTVYALLKLGYRKEAREFMGWVEKQCNDIGDAGNLGLMYRIDGGKDLFETELQHLEGYQRSKPVRIGNAAHSQVQLDIYGELLDAIYLFDKHGESISYNFWINIAKQVNWVSENWHLEDEGIWEIRSGKKAFLYSRLMCWVALDRGVKIADAHSYPLNQKWRDERDKIFDSIHQEFWNPTLKSFTQYKGAETVDAATLLMPLVRFISPTDPKWLSTLKKIEDDLVSDSLVYRYRANEYFDGLTGGEGTFSMCTFWYVECLSKAGQLNKARLFFEKMLGYANHVGLYSEMLGMQGEHLGNFPQAFTHLGLITAALSLDHQFADQRNRELE